MLHDHRYLIFAHLPISLFAEYTQLAELDSRFYKLYLPRPPAPLHKFPSLASDVRLFDAYTHLYDTSVTRDNYLQQWHIRGFPVFEPANNSFMQTNIILAAIYHNSISLFKRLTAKNGFSLSSLTRYINRESEHISQEIWSHIFSVVYGTGYIPLAFDTWEGLKMKNPSPFVIHFLHAFDSQLLHLPPNELYKTVNTMKISTIMEIFAKPINCRKLISRMHIILAILEKYNLDNIYMDVCKICVNRQITICSPTPCHDILVKYLQLALMFGNINVINQLATLPEIKPSLPNMQYEMLYCPEFMAFFTTLCTYNIAIDNSVYEYAYIYGYWPEILALI